MINAPRFGLSERIIQDITDVFNSTPWIVKAWIFGSRAKGNFRDGSDIDLAVSGPSATPHDVAELWARLDDLALVFKVDLVHVESLSNEALTQKIRTEGVLLLHRA